MVSEISGAAIAAFFTVSPTDFFGGPPKPFGLLRPPFEPFGSRKALRQPARCLLRLRRSHCLLRNAFCRNFVLDPDPVSGNSRKRPFIFGFFRLNLKLFPYAASPNFMALTFKEAKMKVTHKQCGGIMIQLALSDLIGLHRLRQRLFRTVSGRYVWLYEDGICPVGAVPVAKPLDFVDDISTLETEEIKESALVRLHLQAA